MHGPIGSLRLSIGRQTARIKISKGVRGDMAPLSLCPRSTGHSNGLGDLMPEWCSVGDLLGGAGT